MKVVGMIPVKSSSSRVPSKNTKLLGGEPLFRINLKKLISSPKITETYLNTESEYIVNLASDLDCKVFNRDEALASNSTDGNKLLLDFAEKVESDIYVMLLCTSPFISVESINKAVEILESDKDCDSVVAVRKEKMYLWDSATKQPLYDINNIPNSFDLKYTVIEAMSLYAIRRESLLSTKRRIGDSVQFLNLSFIESFDINYPEDFSVAEVLWNVCPQR